MLSLEQQDHWREIYRRSHPNWQPATEIFAAFVRRELRPDSRLLDLGCGRGGIVEQLGHPPARMTGIDPDYLSLHQHRLISMPRAAALSDQLPFAADSFDIVIAGWLLEHLVAPSRSFSAICRVLRPGGAFIFITPNTGHPVAWLNRVAGRLGQLQGWLVSRIYNRSEADTFSTYYQANSPAAIAGLTSNAGLTLESIEYIADPSYLAFNRLLYNGMSAIDDYLPPTRRIHIVGLVRKQARSKS